MTDPVKRAARADAADLSALAAQGVERALAARRTVTELTPEQTREVSGGALALSSKLANPIIYGLWNPEVLRPETLLQQQLQVNKTLAL